MPTKNPRINVTFDEIFAGILTKLARDEHKSVAGLVRELAMEALEMREDIYFSKLADRIDHPNAKTYSHTEAWK